MKFKPYPEYKDSGVEWIGYVPEEWEIRPLRDKVTIYNHSISSEHLKKQKKVFHYSIPNFDEHGGGFEEDGESIDSNKYLINRNLLIISKLNPRKSRVLLAKKDPKLLTVCSTEFVPLELRNINSKFAIYLLSSEISRQFLDSRTNSATHSHKRIDPNIIPRYSVVIPPSHEQSYLASFLDKKTSKIDLTIEKDTRLIELLKEKRTALINHVVTKGLDPTVKMKDSGVEWIGEIPEDWEVVPLTKFLESKSDYRGKTPEKVDLGVFLVTGKNIKNGKIDYELSKEYVPEDQYDMIMRRGKPKIGDLLVTTEAPLGEVANVDFSRIALAQRIIKMRGKEGILDNYFLKYYMMSETFQGHLQRLATGSTALGIKASKLFILRLILPPYSTQLEIVNNLEESISKIDQIIQKIQKKIELLEEYKKSLIHHVITGKVDVREVAV